MDIVFHRNCLDGAYSAYLMYLFCKTLPLQTYHQFIEHLRNQKTNELQIFHSEQIMMRNCEKLDELFFHTQTQIPFHFVSMFAGDLFPISPSKAGNILFLIDISPSTEQLMISMAQKFTFVVIIDHHTSFSKNLQTIADKKLQNVFYVWNEEKCATQLVQEYLFRSFGFPKNLPDTYRESLMKQIQFVSKNDLKRKQTRVSKQFVLGFYYYEIQLNHNNPLLFKRIWGLNLQILLQKGANLYKQHIQCLIKQVQSCLVSKIVKSKYKNTQFLSAEIRQPGLISDLGSILSYLSVKFGFSNLAMIFNKRQCQYKVSFRSSKLVNKDPRALQISVYYDGGGHTHAAGCSIEKSVFHQHFKSQGHLKPAIKITAQQIQNILFPE